MPKTLPTLLTVQQAADQLQFSGDAIYRLIHSGALTACRLGGAIRISQDDLNAFIKAGRGVRIRPHRKNTKTKDAFLARESK
jgi:excisionase family DNA binding protein